MPLVFPILGKLADSWGKTLSCGRRATSAWSYTDAADSVWLKPGPDFSSPPI